MPRSLPLHFPLLVFMLAGFPAALAAQPAVPAFTGNVAVHDPSVLRVGGQHYVFGSHIAAARTSDLMNWTMVSSGPTSGDTLIPNITTQLAEAIAWAGANNYWAPDVHRLSDGRYRFYYCVTAGDSPRSALGVAVADAPGGPYTHQQVLLRSGMWGQISPDGTIYDATKHPNCIDPALFEDAIGRLWMVYGSYSGGIYVIRLDPATGVPLAGQGYGKKLIGKNHSRIEAPYILYSPATGYYYLFLSFGGLDAAGGYQVRIGRSVNPDGPFFDPAGNDLTNVGGPAGSFFDDAAIAPYGAKLIGNYQFLHVAGEPRTTSRGYLSPGHNSASYDPATGRHLMYFHTRFVGRGEAYEVRVHQLYPTADGWLVVAPHRYAQETPAAFVAGQLTGQYKLVNFAKDISANVHTSTLITLAANGAISGGSTGTWSLSGDHFATLNIDGVTYRGVFSRQWDDDNQTWVIAFSALSSGGVTVWGSKVAAPNLAPAIDTPADQTLTYGDTLQLAVTASDPDFAQAVAYSLVDPPPGAQIDAATGLFTWTPPLAAVGMTHQVTLRATDNGADPAQSQAAFDVTVEPATVMNRLDLTFSQAGASGLRDKAGLFTGFTSRLSGTGGAVPTNDPLLALSAAAGTLTLTSNQADYNGSAGLATNRSIGVVLSSLGFTGGQDFAVTAVFRPLTGLGYVDQVGVFAGANATTLTRSGAIVWGVPERYTVNTRSGSDVEGHFTDLTLDVTDGLTVTIQRQDGQWRAYIDGKEWSAGVAPTFLDAFGNLTVGVFAVTPLNTNPKNAVLDAFSVIVDTGLPLPTPIESWRMSHFGTATAAGDAADAADPDADGLVNLLEYALGSSPVSAAERPLPALDTTETAEGRVLTLAFNRISDPSLAYTVQASDDVSGGFVPIWSSTGAANTAGVVVVSDTVPLADVPRRFLRLQVTR